MTKHIMHFHFSNWSDFDVPKRREELLELVRDVRQEAARFPGTDTIVVNCRFVLSSVLEY